MKLLKFSILIILSSCGKPTEPVNKRHVDPELAPYVVDIEILLGVEANFGIHLAETHKGTVGECHEDERGQKEIRINPGYFNNASDAQREMVIAHELGHCLLGKKHDNSYKTFEGFNGTYPTSIMNSFAFNEDQLKVYTANRHYYYTRLKN